MPRIIKVPMMKETRDKIALRIHSLASQCTEKVSFAVFDAISKELAVASLAHDINGQNEGPIRSRKDSLSKALVSALDALVEAESCGMKDGFYTLTEPQQAHVKALAARFDEWLSKIPFNVYQHSLRTIETTLNKA